MHGLISMFSVWTALLRVYEKNLVITRSLRKKKLHSVNSLSRSMCQDFRSEKSLLSFDSRKATTLRMIPLNLRILGGRLREVRPYYVLFLCLSYVRTPGHLKICWRADVHSAKHEQGETAAFAGFDRVEKRAIVSTFCASYVLSLSLLSNIWMRMWITIWFCSTLNVLPVPSAITLRDFITARVPLDTLEMEHHAMAIMKDT